MKELEFRLLNYSGTRFIRTPGEYAIYSVRIERLIFRENIY